jgi:hypothetical protein
MPQNAIPVTAARNPSNAQAAESLDAVGNLLVTDGGLHSSLDITTVTVVKSSPGRLCRVSVLVAGAAGAVYDATSTSGNTAADEVWVIPATVGIYTLNWPCLAGIVVSPGASQVVSVSYT